jgi:DNA-binding YbaB/EbfC family protein
MKNLGQMMKQAAQVQAKMADMQKRLEEMEMEGASGGGLVKVTISGKGDVRKIKLDPSVVDPADVEVLEDLIVAACNDAKTKSEAAVQDEMQKITGGLNLPPGMKLPF